MKNIFMINHPQDGRIFVAANFCVGLVRFESATGLKFEPTGLKCDNFGIDYAQRFGKILTLSEVSKRYSGR